MADQIPVGHIHPIHRSHNHPGARVSQDWTCCKCSPRCTHLLGQVGADSDDEALLRAWISGGEKSSISSLNCQASASTRADRYTRSAARSRARCSGKGSLLRFRAYSLSERAFKFQSSRSRRSVSGIDWQKPLPPLPSYKKSRRRCRQRRQSTTVRYTTVNYLPTGHNTQQHPSDKF